MMWTRWFRTILACLTLLITMVVRGEVSYASLTDAFDYYEVRKKLTPLIIDSIDQGLRWLEIQQGPDGLFHGQVGITALVVAAFLKHPEQKYNLRTHPFLQRSVNALTSYSNLDGSICDRSLLQMAHPSYTTSVCLLALAATNSRNYYQQIRDGRTFLKSLQMVKGEDHTRYFGGINYSLDQQENYDLSNLSLALLTLDETRNYMTKVMKQALPDDSSFLSNAKKFILRCQSNEANEDYWGTNLGSNHYGGFIYSPNGESKTMVTGRPYGSMTAAGLLSLMHVNAKESHLRDTFEWICNNWQLDKNPGMNRNQATKGLYYYYYNLALALAAYEEIRTMKQGQIIFEKEQPKVFWFQELAEALIKRKIVNSVVANQDIPDPANPNESIFYVGDRVDLAYWRNQSSFWMERDTVLTTAYAVLALQVIMSIE